jgi:hypothetical protein
MIRFYMVKKCIVFNPDLIGDYSNNIVHGNYFH